MFNVYKNQLSRQTGSRNLTGPKTLPTIWGTYMKLVTKYQISTINSCWEKCAYMFNVYKNQLSWQTGSRNLTGPKTLPTIWYTYMTFVTKYQISAINSYWEKCDKKYLGRTDRGKTVYPPPPSGSVGIITQDKKQMKWVENMMGKEKLSVTYYLLVYRNKSNNHHITKILLKLALNTLILILSNMTTFYYFWPKTYGEWSLLCNSYYVKLSGFCDNLCMSSIMFA